MVDGLPYVVQSVQSVSSRPMASQVVTAYRARQCLIAESLSRTAARARHNKIGETMERTRRIGRMKRHGFLVNRFRSSCVRMPLETPRVNTVGTDSGFPATRDQ